jgi:hypothetical protein
MGVGYGGTLLQFQHSGGKDRTIEAFQFQASLDFISRLFRKKKT